MRKVFYTLLITVGVFLAVVSLAPMILSLNWTKTHVVEPYLGRVTGGKVRVEHLDLSWVTGQSARAISWEGSNGQLSITSLETEAPLWRFILSPFKDLDIELDDLKFNRRDEEEHFSLSGTLSLGKLALHLDLTGEAISGENQGEITAEGTLPFGNRLRAWLYGSDVDKDASLVIKVSHFPTDLLPWQGSFCSVSATELWGPLLNADFEMRHGFCSLSLATSALQGSIQAEISEEGFAFKDQSALVYTMPLAAQEALRRSGELPVFLKPVVITFSDGSRPQIVINSDMISIGPSLYVKQFNGNIQFLDKLKTTKVQLGGRIDDSGVEGRLSLRAELYTLPGKSSFCEISGSSLPTTLIDQFLGLMEAEFDAFAHSAIGNTMDFTLSISQERGKRLAKLNLTSERLSIPLATFQLDRDRFYLTESAQVDLNFSPATFYRLNQIEYTGPYVHDVPLTIQLNNLSYNYLEGCGSVSPDQFGCNMVVSIKELTLHDRHLLGVLRMQNLLFSVNAPSLSHVDLEVIGKAAGFDQSYAIPRLFEEAFRFEGKLHVEVDPYWLISPKELRLHAEDEHLIVNLEGKPDPKNPQHLLTEGQINLLLKNNTFQRVHQTDSFYTLMRPSVVELHVDRFSFNPLRPLLSTSNGEFRVLVDEFVVADRGGNQASLKELAAELKLSSEDNSIDLKLKGHTHSEGVSEVGKIAGVVRVKEWLDGESVNLSRAEITADLTSRDFPVDIFSALLDQPALKQIAGPFINTSIKIQDQVEETPGSVELVVSGTGFQLEGSLLFTDHLRIDPHHPLAVKWHVTPERFTAMREAWMTLYPENVRSIVLLQSVDIEMELLGLEMPFNDLGATKAELSFQIPDVTIHDKNHDQTAYLQLLSGEMLTENLQSSLNLNLAAFGTYDHELRDTFNMKLVTTFTDLYSEEKGFHPSEAMINLEAHVDSAPALLILELICLNPDLVEQLDALMGKRLTGNLFASFQESTGPINLQLAGTEGTFSLSGRLNQGVLTLTDYLVAEFTLTEKLSRSVLGEIMPLLGSARSASQPVSIVVGHEGFSFDLTGDVLQDLTIPNMKIDFGMVFFNNDQQINEILNILKFSSQRDLVPVWFTPLYLSYEKGVAKVRRMDMLVADRYPLALWGKVNFIQDRVDMTLGLGGKTLQRAFGLKAVPDNYYLQLALKGTTSDARLDIRGSATKIAAFIAQLRGGPQGVIVGGILDLIGGTLGQKKTPKPTTWPFPWDANNSTRPKGKGS